MEKIEYGLTIEHQASVAALKSHLLVFASVHITALMDSSGGVF